MTDFGTKLPFELQKIDRMTCRERRSILRQYPGSMDGIRLVALGHILTNDDLKLHLTGIKYKPKGMPSDCVAVALTSRARPASFRGVLGLTSELAMAVVNRTLGREHRPDDARTFPDEVLVPGEKGALLFALDAAAGDWISIGGRKFVVKGLLYDGDQVPDYLRGRPDWEITGSVRGTSVTGDLWFWFRSPMPANLTPRKTDIGEQAWLWRPTVCLVVGFANLSVTDVTGLSSGDRVVLDGWNHPFACDGAAFATLVSGGWARYGRWLDNRNIEVISTKERAEEMDKSSNQDRLSVIMDPPDSEDEGEMAVTVSVEVGSIRASVRQAAALVPGTILGLDKPVGPEVVLKVQGKLIGRGVLVDQDGLMSVEIKEVLV